MLYLLLMSRELAKLCVTDAKFCVISSKLRKTIRLVTVHHSGCYGKKHQLVLCF